MKKLIESIKTIVRHNVFLATAGVAVICLCVWLIGCNSTTTSPFNPAQKVTRNQLAIQVDTYNKMVELAMQDLDRQDMFKQYLIDSMLVTTQTGTINPMGVVMGAVGLLGLGAMGSNVHKDSVIRGKDVTIKALQNGNKTETV